MCRLQPLILSGSRRLPRISSQAWRCNPTATSLYQHKLPQPTLRYDCMKNAYLHTCMPTQAVGSGGGPGHPTFLDLFVELRNSVNTCQFRCVSVMTDQTPKPAIGAKWKPLSSA